MTELKFQSEKIFYNKTFTESYENMVIKLFLLKNNNMEVAITNYGGRIVSWLAPDKRGEVADIVLGFNSIGEYLNADENYFGAIIGRYANRLANGTFAMNGQEYQLNTNSGDHHLHGGSGGFHNVVWDAKKLNEQHLVLQYLSEDGEEGFPGNLNVQVQYILTDENKLKIDYTAVTDKTTPISLTNHAYFNLAGAADGKITDHRLMIDAEKFMPVDSTLIPTGEMLEVENTPFDFTKATAIGKRFNSNNEQLEYGKGYDHNFILRKDQPGTLKLAARVSDPASGRVMEVHTTEPCIQFYSGNSLDGSDIGKDGKPYLPQTAFCLEPQHFPDSLNQPNFPSSILKSDSVYHSLSVYHVTAK